MFQQTTLFYLFPQDSIWQFMQIVSKLFPMEIICMKCRILFSGKSKKNKQKKTTKKKKKQKKKKKTKKQKKQQQ